MFVMDSGKVVVIFSGYKEPMKRVIASNEGFCRRVIKFFYFDGFSSQELAKILHIKMNDQVEDSLLYGFRLHPSCGVDGVAALIERVTTEKQPWLVGPNGRDLFLISLLLDHGIRV
ncbi:AAA-type ATPase family protein / ankyrin repeat family protein [Quillaja saponaria]|uniref:AAA-type ATPase family protein / ankyrin repeat family protein n=1 Tax=Quillaja saponaria TaxID=32244 RepID=A0AAD7VFR0_QUISA|nr:AAA-type ATPase family protein / ankyrin repeat family protein [Quillaja saponaria]KAJ7973870.1 AAA-type ATPase family protein / ankyrin repeat family protein [Quillaja saponaria]